MFLHHIFKGNMNEEEKLKKAVINGHKIASAVKQWSFKAFGSFKEITCMNEYLLNDSVFIYVRAKQENV